MKTQTTLFDKSAFPADPWEIPANLKRIGMKEWVRENAVELANTFCKERPKFSFLDNDLIEEFVHWKIQAGFVRVWVEKKYEEAMQHV